MCFGNSDLVLSGSASPALTSIPDTKLLRRGGAAVRVLVVAGGETVVAEVVSAVLRGEGAQVVTARDARAAVSVAHRVQPDLVILDTRLPDMSAVQALRKIRAHCAATPALLLCPAGEEPDRVTRFTAGDDWLATPFSAEDLLLRVRMVLHRSLGDDGPSVGSMTLGDLVLDEQSRTVARAGEDIYLAHTEFEVLRFFMRNAHRVVTKQQILSRVWPYDYSGRQDVVHLYVSYLRKKIDRGRSPMIHTLRLTGYILKAAT